MFVSTDYHEAFAHAQEDANRFVRPMGLERAQEFGRTVYRVKMIPCDPDQRFGWETRCEVVEPVRCAWCSTDPISPEHAPFCSTVCGIAAHNS